jgi:hypothetical protein
MTDYEVTRFVIQLEYWLDGDWREVVRYDHDHDAPGGHDVTEEEFDSMPDRSAGTSTASGSYLSGRAKRTTPS